MFIMDEVKKLFALSQGLFAYLLLAFPVLAQTTETGSNVNPCLETNDGIAKILCDLSTNPGTTIRSFVVLLVVLAVVIALLWLLYGGIKWITSRGEKTEVEAARNHIQAAIIGLIVVFLSIFLLSLVLQAFGITWDLLQLPKIGT
jgi:amino acid transporter